ncbi:MAG: hypothetical protein ACNYPI_05540 [Arenicellales bacterium WSBS_2016_MAG_OTU3]
MEYLELRSFDLNLFEPIGIKAKPTSLTLGIYFCFIARLAKAA